MLCRSAAALAALACASVCCAREVKSFSPYQMAVGQRFEIQTEDGLYRGQLLDRSTGEVLLAAARDGEDFGPERRMFLLGSTQGRQEGYLLVLMHQIKSGLKMELAVKDLAEEHRYLTAPVTAIRLEP
jgi:hypothetical protein